MAQSDEELWEFWRQVHASGKSPFDGVFEMPKDYRSSHPDSFDDNEERERKEATTKQASEALKFLNDELAEQDAILWALMLAKRVVEQTKAGGKCQFVDADRGTGKLTVRTLKVPLKSQPPSRQETEDERQARLTREYLEWVRRRQDTAFREGFNRATRDAEARSEKAWWLDELQIDHPFTRDDVNKAYRTRAKQVHPDNGGTQEQFVKLGEARTLALAYLGVHS